MLGFQEFSFNLSPYDSRQLDLLLGGAFCYVIVLVAVLVASSFMMFGRGYSRATRRWGLVLLLGYIILGISACLYQAGPWKIRDRVNLNIGLRALGFRHYPGSSVAKVYKRDHSALCMYVELAAPVVRTDLLAHHRQAADRAGNPSFSVRSERHAGEPDMLLVYSSDQDSAYVIETGRDRQHCHVILYPYASEIIYRGMEPGETFVAFWKRTHHW